MSIKFAADALAATHQIIDRAASNVCTLASIQTIASTSCVDANSAYANAADAYALYNTAADDDETEYKLSSIVCYNICATACDIIAAACCCAEAFISRDTSFVSKEEEGGAINVALYKARSYAEHATACNNNTRAVTSRLALVPIDSYITITLQQQTNKDAYTCEILKSEDIGDETYTQRLELIHSCTYNLEKDAYFIRKVVEEIREIPTTNIIRANKDSFTRCLIENLATEVDDIVKKAQGLIDKTRALVAKTAVAGSVQDLKDKETK
ncbi:hypothetical protein AGMMS49936_06560 [Endomicrobiia bacterium]|nr:hypothetical protein AGMMS49936_06560 [Endomicrobiia bacterium]